MSSVPCFFLTPTDRYCVSLRRYAEGACTGRFSYHNASSVIVAAEQHNEQPPSGYCDDQKSIVAPDDPRWPATCPCGYAFVPTDSWQLNYDGLYTRSDGGPDTTLRAAPAGAMWDAEWMGKGYDGPDGVHLCVRLPDGAEWCVDGPSFNDRKITNPRGWTRTGTIPLITARPSILTSGYHGYLTDGKLVSC